MQSLNIKPSAQIKVPAVLSRSRELKMDRDKVTLKLSREKALILHAMLTRINNDASAKLVHPSERKVLWDLEYLLQNMVPEVASVHYDAKVAQARENIWPKPVAAFSKTC